MRETELWKRMDTHLGAAYSRTWAQSVVLADLDGRTVAEALSAGVPCKDVWRAVWRMLGLPARER